MQRLYQIFLLLIFAASLAALLLASSAATAPAQTAFAKPPSMNALDNGVIGWPFDPSQGPWVIENGYNWNTSNGGLDHGCSNIPNYNSCYELDSFDFQRSGPPGSTAGQTVLSPATGTVTYVVAAFNGAGSCIGIALEGQPGYYIIICHVDNPKTGHLDRGKPLGTVNKRLDNGDHIHMTLYHTPGTADNGATRQPIAFSDPWRIGGCAYTADGSQHQWSGTAVPCAQTPGGQAPAEPPAPSTAFWLPIQAPNEVYVTQGNNQGDHVAALGQKYAFDLVACHNQFSTCAGSFVITAAQSGTVLGVNDASTAQCGLPCPCWKQANFILIQNDDDPRHTASLYLHIMPGSAMVRRGQHVAAGTPLAMAGTTGCSTGIHLHFQVEAVPTYSANPSTGWWYTNSQPVNFADPDVLAVDSNGIPQTGNVFNLGIGAPTPTATATPVPTATPIPTVTPVPVSGQPGSCTSTTFGIIATCAMVAVISRRRLPKQRPAKRRSERQGE